MSLTTVVVAAGVAVFVVGVTLFAFKIGPFTPTASRAPLGSDTGGLQPTGSPRATGGSPAIGSGEPSTIPAASVVPSPGGLPSLPPAPDRPIAYARTAGSSTIWSMEPGGTPTQLIADASSSGASWSRDAHLIAFIRQVGKGPGEVWVMNADGSAAHALTKGAGAVGHPTWSPSGDRIAFAAVYDTGDVQLWIIPSAGGDPVQDTFVTGSPGAPSWSPDGQSLVYANTINGRSGLLIADPANPVSPTIGLFGVADGVNRSPEWSPDGTKIAFDSTLNGTDQIWVMNSDGSDPNAVTPPALSAAWPAWSPDGKQLVFQVTKGSDTDLYVMSADGSAAPVDITKDPKNDAKHAAFEPAWW